MKFRPTTVLPLVLIATPIVLSITYSLAAAAGWIGVGARSPEGLMRIARVLSERAVWQGTVWTIWVALASTAVATVAAVTTAAVFRGRGRASQVTRAVATLPLPVPHVVAGLAALLILGQSGMLARVAHAVGWLDLPADMPALVSDRFGVGLILALAWKEFAFLALVAWSVLAERGERQEEAARTLGAGAWNAFRYITLPILGRGMLPAIVAVFAFVLGSYEAAALLAPSHPLPLPVLTMERYFDADVSRRADAYVLVLLSFALAVLAVATHQGLRSRWSSLP